MTDLTDFLSNAPVHRNRCFFGEWLSKLSEEEQNSVRKALLDPGWSASALAEGLKKFGSPVGRESIRKHQQGKCTTCGPI
jgi:hypothetical protein